MCIFHQKFAQYLQRLVLYPLLQGTMDQCDPLHPIPPPCGTAVTRICLYTKTTPFSPVVLGRKALRGATRLIAHLRPSIAGHAPCFHGGSGDVLPHILRRSLAPTGCSLKTLDRVLFSVFACVSYDKFCKGASQVKSLTILSIQTDFPT